MDINKTLENLSKRKLDNLTNLYGIINEICSDYSRMTDGYSLATGDRMFENMPKDIRDMINDRQKFFSYRNIVKDAIKIKLTEIMENNGIEKN